MMGEDVLLNRHGELFRAEADKLYPINHSKCKDPYDSFFRTPFYAVARVVNGRIAERIPMTPSDFNPGSVFDATTAVASYVKDQTLMLPRMYLYPTAKCNCHCPICQFHDRHRQGYELSRESMIKAFDVLKAYRGNLNSQALIVSGDGEPLLYPHLVELLCRAQKDGLRVFLTTNLTLSPNAHLSTYEEMARSLSMLTVSIKGITNVAYQKYQGMGKQKTLSSVLKNLEAILKLRDLYDRRRNMVIGVASLILPENTGAYLEFIDYLHIIGVDYVYFNQVEPSAKKWGIEFTERQKQETLSQLRAYAGMPHDHMIVRCAGDPFQNRNADSVYYDAAKERIDPNICGSSLFNPLVLSSRKGAMRLMACRNSDWFSNEDFTYQLDANGHIVSSSIDSVMRSAKNCTRCRLERQVKHFDKLIEIERRNEGKGDYGLLFDLEKLKRGDYRMTQFEQVAK